MGKQQILDNNFHLSRKLIGTVVAFVIAASGLVVLTNFSINIIAATGDYTRLLSTWNEQHHQSMVSLQRFVHSGEQVDYNEYLKLNNSVGEQAIVVDELFNADPDVATIFDSFSSKDVYPNEISSLIFAFQQFRKSDKVQSLFNLWQQLSNNEAEKQEVGQSIYQEWNSEQPNREQLNQYLTDLNELNQEWHSYNQQLMDEVGSTSAIIKRGGLWVSVILGILLVLIGVVVTVRANKSIGRWEQTLTEKEILLSEIHHRVKNNMAVVSGLLELESMQDRDPEQALQDSRDRLQSMAMIHEILYQSESFSDINLSQYLNNLTNYIGETYIHDQKDIHMQTNFDDVILNINQAVPVGLIVNEMLTNAITHGLDTIENGEIALLLSELDGKISLSIKDNGKGLPGDFNYNSADSSGLLIVKTLVQQLDADVTFENRDGMTFNLQFQKSDASGSSNARL